MELLSHIELATGADPRGTVIWMHGLGADGWDFVPIVRELDLPEDLAAVEVEIMTALSPSQMLKRSLTHWQPLLLTLWPPPFKAMGRSHFQVKTPPRRSQALHRGMPRFATSNLPKVNSLMKNTSSEECLLWYLALKPQSPSLVILMESSAKRYALKASRFASSAY